MCNVKLPSKTEIFIQKSKSSKMFAIKNMLKMRVNHKLFHAQVPYSQDSIFFVTYESAQ